MSSEARHVLRFATHSRPIWPIAAAEAHSIFQRRHSSTRSQADRVSRLLVCRHAPWRLRLGALATVRHGVCLLGMSPNPHNTHLASRPGAAR